MIPVMNLAVSADIQPRCRSHSAHLTEAVCGPLLEPRTAFKSPQAGQPFGKTTVRPTKLVLGAVAKEKLCCMIYLRSVLRAAIDHACHSDDLSDPLESECEAPPARAAFSHLRLYSAASRLAASRSANQRASASALMYRLPPTK